jgi:hypothetical protein
MRAPTQARFAPTHVSTRHRTFLLYKPSASFLPENRLAISPLHTLPNNVCCTSTGLPLCLSSEVRSTPAASLPFTDHISPESALREIHSNNGCLGIR